MVARPHAMCRSPTRDEVAADCVTSPSRGDRSPEVKGDDDFSFGTTKPIQLPVVVAPKVLNEAQNQTDHDASKQALSESLHQPQQQAQSQTLLEALHPTQHLAQTETLDPDEEFTFGTTKPLALPDISEFSSLGYQPQLSPTIVCAPSDGHRNTVNAGIDAGSYNPNSYIDHTEVMESRPLTGSPLTGELYRQSVSQSPQQPFGYSSPVVSSIDPGYWSYPSPMVTFPMMLPYCAVSPLYLNENGATAMSDVSATVNPDVAEAQDLERDIETGVGSEPCCEILQLKSLSSHGVSSKSRRLIAASCMGLLFFCLAVVIAILVIF